MNTATIKNWSTWDKGAGFSTPETALFCLVGDIYGDTLKRFTDGSRISTSAIRDIINCGDYKVLETKSGVKYAVYPGDVDPEYESRFPGAYERLRMDRAL